jgi:hypothetical protein
VGAKIQRQKWVFGDKNQSFETVERAQVRRCLYINLKMFSDAYSECVPFSEFQNPKYVQVGTCNIKFVFDPAMLDNYFSFYSVGGLMLTDKGVESSFRFVNLRKINVSICRYLTDDGFIRISKFNPRLEVLEARYEFFLRNYFFNLSNMATLKKC